MSIQELSAIHSFRNVLGHMRVLYHPGSVLETFYYNCNYGSIQISQFSGILMHRHESFEKSISNKRKTTSQIKEFSNICCFYGKNMDLFCWIIIMSIKVSINHYTIENLSESSLNGG